MRTSDEITHGSTTTSSIDKPIESSFDQTWDLEGEDFWRALRDKERVEILQIEREDLEDLTAQYDERSSRDHSYRLPNPEKYLRGMARMETWFKFSTRLEQARERLAAQTLSTI